jgi:hypothetical protein
MMFHSTFHGGRDAMIEAAHALLDECDAVIHYNGSRFDIPTLNREFVLHGLNPPSPYKQIDLLKTARAAFKFPSNKLDYVLEELGLEQKVQHKGMDLWKECMAGDEKAWRTMKRYNVADVRIMEPLYDRLLPWIADHPNAALYLDAERPTCTKCGGSDLQSRGTYKTKTGSYRKFQCQCCGSWVRSRKSEVKNTDAVLSDAR